MQEARKARGISQRALRDRLADAGLDLNQAAIARMERGERKITLDEAVTISAVLDVAPVHLFLPVEGNGPVWLAPDLVTTRLRPGVGRGATSR